MKLMYSLSQAKWNSVHCPVERRLEGVIHHWTMNIKNRKGLIPLLITQIGTKQQE